MTRSLTAWAVGLIVVLLAVVPATVASAVSPGAVVYKQPFSANIFLGGPALVVTENVAGADRPITGFQLDIRYDPDVLDVTFEPGPLLTVSGRTVSCETIPIVVGESMFSCVASGSGPPSAGPGTIARFTVRPAAGLRIRPTKDNGIAALLDDRASGTRLFDAGGHDIAIGQVTDTNVVVRALEADLDYDCRVSVIDDQDQASRYPATFGSLVYNAFHDLEPFLAPDDDIDIKDLQFVFGRNGSTCEKPTPPQPSPTPVATPGTPIPVTPTRTPAAPTVTSVPPTPIATETVAATPSPAGTETPAATPEATRTSAASTATPAATASPTAGASVTPLPATPSPVSTQSGGGARRTPVAGLPGAGTGSDFADGPAGMVGLTLLIAGVAFASAVFGRTLGRRN